MKPIARKENIVVQDTQLETLVYDLALNKAFLLNKLSAFVWQNCDGTKEISEISKTLANRSKQPVNEDVVWLAIEQLKTHNLLENAEELKSGFEGLNRREVIKKIGFGTITALPVITGLMVPTAVSARSCLGPGQTDSGQLILSGGTPFCSASQSVCTSSATANVNGCCSGAATLEFNNTDCGGSDPTNVCRCV